MDNLDLDKTLVQADPAPAIQGAQLVQTEPLQAPEALSPEAIHDKSESVVLLPTMRIDGASIPAPWGESEPGIWWMLTTAPLEHVEERVLDGTNGYFWGRTRKPTGELVSVVVKPDGLKHDIYKHWSAEFMLDPDIHSLTVREQAAYEISKAMGMENQIPPMAAREIEVGTLLGISSKEILSKMMKVSRSLIDDIIGKIASLQLVVYDSKMLGEHLSTLGDSPEDKWNAASDSLRHSIYCTIALDFLLGTGERTNSSLSYNNNLDKVTIYDLCLSLPHPGFTAEKLMRQRAKGWSRNITPGAKKQKDGPLCAVETFNFIDTMSEKQKNECVMTFQQIGQLLTTGKIALLAKIMFELGVPIQCIAGFATRVKYLQMQPEKMLKDVSSFNQQVLASTRRGFGLDENKPYIDFANQIVLSLDNTADFISICQEPLLNQNLKLT